MQRSRIKKRRRQSTELFAAPAFTPRQVMAMVVILALAVVMFPLGARAASLLNVVITDSGGINKAHVDSSGNVQVGVANTPNVNVTNTPNVGIASSANTVRIGNPASNPASVQDVDDPGRQLFQQQASWNMPDGTSATPAFVGFVPSGKRLVIQSVTGFMFLPTGEHAVGPSIETNSGPTITGRFYLAAPTEEPCGSNSSCFQFSHQITVYVDEGEGVSIRVSRDSASGSASGRVTLSGYLIDCTTGLPCS